MFLLDRPVARSAIGILIFLLPFFLAAHSGHKDKPEKKPQVLAPGYQSLNFQAPVPASYDLPVVANAADGEVLAMNGSASRLHRYMGDKYVVLSFIYTQCDDVNGCPLATYVSSQVQNKLLTEAQLQDQVRFISLSFDPDNDTPAVMRRYGENFIRDNFDWQFLTTQSNRQLDPILQAYSQSILRDIDENGNTTGSISHILRVFLIDREKRIRNIYSTSFLHPDTVINDIKTLLAADRSTSRAGRTHNPSSAKPQLHGAGDFKQGYEDPGYQTRTQSLQTRRGKAADLLKIANTPTLGLPALPVPADNALSAAKIQLGRQLFYERRLSHNATFSCAMCHIPEQGFSSNELSTAVGVEGRTVRRNTPSLYNVGYAKRLFHDGRENSLEQQVWGPLLAHNEMANPSVGHVLDKINAISDYRQQFKAVFNDQSADIKNLGQALASYERSLISANSPFDRWYYGGETRAINKEAIAGFKLFSGKAGCIACHSINEKHALFSDYELHNTGIGYRKSMAKTPARQKVLIAPGTYLEFDSDALADSAETPPNDLGYYEISGDPDDRWKYKTPSLRNVALTAPYMHDGSLTNLQQVIEFYNQGGVENTLLDPRIRKLHLTARESAQLLAFLQSLSGDNVDTLISDAFAVPVGNTGQ